MYATMKADIKKGKIIPLEPEKLPKSGRAILVVLETMNARENWKNVRQKLGWLKTDIDPAEWQAKERKKWHDRP